MGGSAESLNGRSVAVAAVSLASQRRSCDERAP